MKQHEWKNPKWNKNEKGKFKKKEKEAANKGKIQNKQKHKRKQNMLTLNLKRHAFPQKMSLLAGNLFPRALFPGFHLQSQGKGTWGQGWFAGSHLACVADLIYPQLVTSLFWAPDELNESLDVHFEIPFNFIIGEWTMAFLTGQS